MSNRVKVLVLGAGYVSAPCVDYLTSQQHITVTVVSHLQEEVARLHSKFSTITPRVLSIDDDVAEIGALVHESVLVISLLPHQYHPQVARLCIQHRVSLVTASYCCEQLRSMQDEIASAGITALTEVGLDPGIDHMLAVKIFDEVKEKRGKIKSFISYCGGLPAPECANNPLKYKFSWSPRDALVNMLRSARYLHNGKLVEIKEGGELMSSARPLTFLPQFDLEGFANRDSTVYKQIYQLPDVATLIRGTIRYQGHSEAMGALHKLGLLNGTATAALLQDTADITWKELLCEQIGANNQLSVAEVRSALRSHLDNDVHLSCIEKLGLLSDAPVQKKDTPLDTLSHHLAQKLSFASGERDLVLMHHSVGIEWSDKSAEQRDVTLVVYGDPHGYSAMATTVGYTVAISANLLVQGVIKKKGLLLPMTSDIYNSVLEELKKYNIQAEECSVAVQPETP